MRRSTSPLSKLSGGRVDVTQPLWTASLVGINVIVFLAMLAATWQEGGAIGRAVYPGFSSGIVDRFGGWYASMIELGDLQRFITAMFLHGSVLHLLFNTVALVQVGSQVEEIFGRRRFLVIYLVTGVAGFVASVLSSAHGDAAWSAFPFDRQPHGLGASGAIFGLFGALVVFALRKYGWTRPLQRSLLSVVIYTGIAVLANLPIDHFAHGGGFVSGCVLGLVMRDRRNPGPAPGWVWLLVEVALVGVLIAAALVQWLGVRAAP
jgi:rhomboid protease GluP